MLRLLISVGLLAFALRSVTWTDLVKTLAVTSLLPILITYLMDQGLTILQAFRWRAVLAAFGIRPPFTATLRALYVGHLFNLFLPTAMGGDVMRYVECRPREGDRLPTALSIAIERYLGIYALLVIAGVGIFVGYDAIPEPVRRYAWIGAGLLVGMTAFLVISGATPPTDGAPAAAGPLRMLAPIRRALALLVRNPRLMARTFLLSMIIQGANYLAIYLLTRALGIDLHPATFFLFVSLIVIATLIPISVGGVGIRETAFLYFFLQAGADRERVLCLSLLTFSRLLVLGLIGTLLYCTSARPSAQAVRDTESGA